MRNKIIEEIYNKHIPEKILSKVNKLNSYEDREDYIQEMYLILLEIPKDKLIKLYEKKELADYFSKICINQMTNQKSTTHTKLQTFIDKSKIEDYENKL